MKILKKEFNLVTRKKRQSQLRRKNRRLRRYQSSRDSRIRARIKKSSRMKNRRMNWKISTALDQKIWSNSQQRSRTDLRGRNISLKTKMRKKRMQPESLVSLISMLFIPLIDTDYSEEKLRSIDMENLNLFGIPLGDDEGEGAKNLGET